MNAGVADEFLDAFRKTGVSPTCIGHAVGNAMSVAVCERLLAR